MIEIEGKRNTAVVYADRIDRETKTQLAELLRDVAFTDSKIRIMPDAHSGKNCVVGTTMTLEHWINPALMGVDIGYGAGRVCSRTDAKYAYSVEEFQEQMKGIYTTTANAGSIDECPMVYKAPEGIIALIKDTVRIEKTIRPIYNFKSCN